MQLACFASAFWVALTRVKDHMHHPGDVIAGALIGTLLQVSNYRVKSLTSEAIPSATQFFKRANTKLAIFPDYKHPGLICLALPPRQKFGLILVIKWLKN